MTCKNMCEVYYTKVKHFKDFLDVSTIPKLEITKPENICEEKN